MHRNKNTGLIWAIGLILLSLILVIVPWDIFNNIGIGRFKISIDNYGELGSFISGVTSPILSFAAFILLFLTYNNQKKELIRTRIDLEEQMRFSLIQRNENTFFNLLSNFNQTLDRITITKVNTHTRGSEKEVEKIIKTGREAIFELIEVFNVYYERAFANGKPAISKFDILDNSYSKTYLDINSNIPPYINNFTQLILFIDSVELGDKKFWIKIVSAQLSLWEQLLLIYHSNSRYDKNGLRPLLKKYNLLDYELIKGDLVDKDFYDKIIN